MYTHYSFQPDTMFSSSAAISSSPEDQMSTGAQNSSRSRAPSSSSSSPLIRMAMLMSRSRWFRFLRRVFHYQNDGSTSNLGSNPFNSRTWMTLEFIALVVQISITTLTIAISKAERPSWPMRIWIVGYDVGCLLNLLLLFGRYRQAHGDSVIPYDIEHQSRSSNEESRNSHLMNKCLTSLELFYALWFVMGNVWMFDSRFGAFHRAPKLHVLCISLLAWNAVTYSFPFLLFLLLCCCVPLISSVLGYNMNIASIDKGASEDQILRLPSWRYKKLADASFELGNPASDEYHECCICLAKYRDKEEVRKLPCSHIFHLKCVDQWLRIISCCPLCKQEVEPRR